MLKTILVVLVPLLLLSYFYYPYVPLLINYYAPTIYPPQ